MMLMNGDDGGEHTGEVSSIYMVISVLTRPTYFFFDSFHFEVDWGAVGLVLSLFVCEYVVHEHHFLFVLRTQSHQLIEKSVLLSTQHLM